MLIIFLFFFLSLSIGILLIIITFYIGKKTFFSKEKFSPYECGFEPFKRARIPFSLRFFLIIIIFLIFDVEIALLLPLGVLSHQWDSYLLFIVSIILMYILTLGFIHEWNQGSLEWSD